MSFSKTRGTYNPNIRAAGKIDPPRNALTNCVPGVPVIGVIDYSKADNFTKLMDQMPTPRTLRVEMPAYDYAGDKASATYHVNYANTQLGPDGKPARVLEPVAELFRKRQREGFVCKGVVVTPDGREHEVVMLPLAPIPAMAAERAAASVWERKAAEVAAEEAKLAAAEKRRAFWANHCKVDTATELLTCGTQTQQDFMDWCTIRNTPATKRMAKKYLQMHPELRKTAAGAEENPKVCR